MRLPSSRASGADPYKLQRQIARYGATALVLAFSSAKGNGTLRFTLIDSKDFLTKPDVAKARKLGKWLEIPVQLDD